MKKLNRKGFTLIELLATIILLAIVLSITIYVSTNLINKSKQKSYEVTINNIVSEANNYLIENSDILTFYESEEENIKYQCVTIQNLIDKGYFDKNVLNSEYKKGVKVKENNYIYIEKNEYQTESKVEFVDPENGTYMQKCQDAINVIGAIDISVDPSSWTKEKTVTITYTVNNLGVDDTSNDYKYGYIFDGEASIIDNVNVKSFTVSKNANLEAMIYDNKGNIVKKVSKQISKIDNEAPIGIVTAKTNGSTVIAIVSASDNNGSGMHDNNPYGYLIQTSSTCPPASSTSYSTSVNSIQEFTNRTTGSYYICVKLTDKINNSRTIVSNKVTVNAGITLLSGNGVSSAKWNATLPNGCTRTSDTVAICNSGVKIALEKYVTITNKRGYTGHSWNKTGGSGTLSGSSFTMETSTSASTLTVSATGIETPTPTVAIASTSKVYGASTTALSGSVSNTYDSAITVTYTYYYDTSSSGSYANTQTASISATSHKGTRYYKVKASASDGTLTSTTSDLSSNNVSLALIRAQYTFNANSCGTVGIAKAYGYKGETKLYTATTGGSEVTPSFTVNTGYTFNGWYTATSGGSKVLNADGTLTGTAVSEYTTATAYNATATKNLYAQCSINSYAITLASGNGVSSAKWNATLPSGCTRTSDTVATCNYNTSINLSTYVTTTRKDGYTGAGYTKSTGSGSISSNTFTVAAGTATITVAATGIETPIPTVAIASTSKVYGASTTVLSGSVSNTYDSAITITYTYYYDTSSSGSYANTQTESISATSHKGTRYYKVKASASDGTLTSTTSDLSSNNVSLALIRAQYTFNANSCGTVGIATAYGYKGETKLYTASTGGSEVTPSFTVNTGYTFNGWYTATSGGSKVLNADGTLTGTAVSGYTTATAYNATETKNLYAQCSEDNYTITLDPNQGYFGTATDINSGFNSHNVYVLQKNVRVPVITGSSYLSLTSGQRYMVGFDYYATGSTAFDVDFYPDSLPEEHPVATTTKQTYYFIAQSSSSDWSNSNIRFFNDITNPNPYDIYISNIHLYKCSDCTLTNEKQIQYGSALETLPTVTRLGYTFNGWYTSASGGSKLFNSDGTFTGTAVSGYTSTTTWVTTQNRTLYAQWIDNIAPTGTVTASVDGTTVTATVSASDNGGVGMSTTIPYGYLIQTNSTCPSSGYTSSTNANYSFTNVADGTYYICVKLTDKNGNSRTIKSSAITVSNEITYSTLSASYKCANSSSGSSPYLMEYSGDCKVSNDGLDSDNWIVKFLTNGTLTFSKEINIDAFLVGGGGGGKPGIAGKGCYGGNGGAGGDSLSSFGITLIAEQSYSITIGSGGTSGLNGSTTEAFDYSAAGGVAGGGGRGAYISDSDTHLGHGSEAGSNGVLPFGFGSSTSGSIYYGASGGGANCWNTAYVHANLWYTNASVSGGTTGGGNGGDPETGSYPGSDGTMNTGAGGGGGSAKIEANYNGGSGGSGIVIIRNNRNQSPFEYSYTGNYEVKGDLTGNWEFVFKSSGILKISDTIAVDVFLVGGGGGGSSTYAGGGGGYTTTEKNISITKNINYAITIGAGGTTGNTGGTTSAFGYSANGGKGGSGNVGGSGGSGGGGYQYVGSKDSTASSGGSDGSNGAPNTTVTHGLSNQGTGQGTTTRAFGESDGELYAGGGGGSYYSGGYYYNNAYVYYTSSGSGGAGGGGSGGYGGNAGDGTPNSTSGTAGTANTGGGGGSGAVGGSGVVIIRNKR